MLLNLYVKNLALIEEVDISFDKGLNILTGETGAGKSIIIGSINLALGQKVPKDIIRLHKESAYIELIFLVHDREKIEFLKTLDVYPDEDGQIIISRKIMTTRSVCKINDETVTTGKIKQVTSLLIDIHGQHEHQSLLYKSKHLEILDEYASLKIHKIKIQITEQYGIFKQLRDKLEGFYGDEESRIRQIDFLKFEIEEIENARMMPGEEEELSIQCRKFSHAKRVSESLSKVYEEIEGDHSAASERIDRALKEFQSVAGFDEVLGKIYDQLYDVDTILSSVARELSDYTGSLTYDEKECYEMENRLDVLHSLHAKYGDSYETVQNALEEKKRILSELENYEVIKEKTQLELVGIEEKLEKNSLKLSKIRQEAAAELSEKIKYALVDLNFLDVTFGMKFDRLPSYTRQGFDDAEFVISTNPGEHPKPLSQVASGGELSRIMLAVKTILADSDHISTLIFDEIDTGISGRTAQKVSEKLSYIGKNHQIICITHLPQIAAMADQHFAIEKLSEDGITTTYIRKLQHEESIEELARLSGGAEITQIVLDHAREMKELAERTKDS